MAMMHSDPECAELIKWVSEHFGDVTSFTVSFPLHDPITIKIEAYADGEIVKRLAYLIARTESEEIT